MSEHLELFRKHVNGLKQIIHCLEKHESHLIGLGMGSAKTITYCIENLYQHIEGVEEAHSLFFNEYIKGMQQSNTNMLNATFAVIELQNQIDKKEGE